MSKDHIDPEELVDLDTYSHYSRDEERSDEYGKRTKREWIEMMDNIRRENGDWSPSDAD